MPKIWIRIPYLGSRGDFLLKSCLNKVQRFLSKPVKFITIYDTKKRSYFVSKKDKLPPLSRSNVVYEVACPGCGKTYIGMTQRCLSICLKEHATRLSSSAVGEHFSECEMHDTWFLYKTSSHYSMIFLYLLTTFFLLRSLFSTTTKYSTQPNLTTTTFLPFLKYYLLNTTKPSSPLVLKGNSTVKTNRAQINVHTFNKLFPKNLGPNHFSKREIVRQSSQIIRISTPCCSFPCRRKSGQRPECDVIACSILRELKIHIGALFKLAKLLAITSKMPHCAVLLCANGSRKTRGMDISYHRLPNGPLKDIWLRNIRQENPRDRGYTYVYSAHFTPDCFEANTGLIPGFKKRKMLKPTAVPTVFSFPTKYSVNKPRLCSVKQIKSREKRI